MFNHRSCDSRRSGFTLIELLIVIGIIVIIASLVIVSVSKARSQGRDSKRIADLASIQLAMEMYKDAHGNYLGDPLPTAWQGCGAPGCTDYAGLKDVIDVSTPPKKISDPLYLGSYLSPIPMDPINKDKYEYQVKVANNPVNAYWIRTRMENLEKTNVPTDAVGTINHCYYVWGGTSTSYDSDAYTGICL